MKYIIESYRSVGDLELSDSKSKIRLKYPIFEEVDKDISEGSNETSDMYNDFFVYYDENEKIKAIEFFGEVKVLFDNQELLHVPYEIVRNFILEKDPNVILDSSGLTSIKLGLGIYCSDAYAIEKGYTKEDYEEEGFESRPTAESVIVFRKGYYED